MVVALKSRPVICLSQKSSLLDREVSLFMSQHRHSFISIPEVEVVYVKRSGQFVVVRRLGQQELVGQAAYVWRERADQVVGVR